MEAAELPAPNDVKDSKGLHHRRDHQVSQPHICNFKYDTVSNHVKEVLSDKCRSSLDDFPTSDEAKVWQVMGVVTACQDEQVHDLQREKQ